MWHEVRLEEEWFSKLLEFDAQIAAAVAAEGCVRCGGPLHQGNYERKPRGGTIARAGEALTLRHSLCCGREGCRRRALPPSLRFLGRRVYLETVVLLATAQAMVLSVLNRARAVAGVPGRTIRRWHRWWTESFVDTPTWQQLRARFVPPPPEKAELPRSLLDRLSTSLGAERGASDVLVLTACWLSPMTTHSVADGSRFAFAALPG